MIIPPGVGTLLGFAKKSGQLLCGETAVETGMKKKWVRLLIMAMDMPEKRRNHWERWCHDTATPCLIMGTKQELGEFLGMTGRSIMAVTDKQLAAAIINKSNAQL